jgi:hypothetical protein
MHFVVEKITCTISQNAGINIRNIHNAQQKLSTDLETGKVQSFNIMQVVF